MNISYFGKPKVSIVIACYNDPNVLVAIQSANAQSYTNKEIIVVDDGSSQDISEIIESGKEYIDHLIIQTNQGQSIARNKGINKATGKYILNLDSDDFFEKSFCEKAVEKLEEGVDVKIVTCKAKRFNKKGVIDIFTPSGGDLNNFLYSNSAMGSSMFRRKDWEACGGYEEKLPILGFEDWEFYLNILKEGGYAYVISEVLFNYNIRENSTTAQIKHLKQDKFKKIILKHRDLYIQNFDDLISNLFERVKKGEQEKLRFFRKPDYKIGNFILRPLRFLKRNLRSGES